MREVNFSIPNVNKASVGITTALYDRRALDCTSTLPLINSLNHLAYLTTSSARIRDILTVDGGVERLVCILKQGRSEEQMEMWKWNLAFQCVVNIGVRGSEAVRTRVVEADMVPVIATILDNYIKVIDKIKAKADCETEKRFSSCRHASSNRSSSQKASASRAAKATAAAAAAADDERQETSAEARGRAAATTAVATATQPQSQAGTHPPRRRATPPPAISIPPPSPSRTRSRTYDQLSAMDISPTLQPTPGSPPRSATLSRHHRHQHHRSDGLRSPMRSAGPTIPAMSTQLPNEAMRDLGLRPVRDSDRLPSMHHHHHSHHHHRHEPLSAGITSQPESPTTPMAPVIQNATTAVVRERRRPSLRQQPSASTDLEDGDADQSPAEMDAEGAAVTATVAAAAAGARGGEPMVDIQSDTNLDDGAAQGTTMLDSVTQPIDLTNPSGAEAPEVETFNMTHAPVQDGSIIPTNIRSTNNLTMNHLQQAQSPIATNVIPATPASRYSLPASAHASVHAAMPRNEDVLLSLQLLAYVSKYCNLRTYFQNSHLVPMLEIGPKIKLLDDDADAAAIETQAREEAEREEYMLPEDYNIFPLVEKFTVRHHSSELQYWAGVVMRNLCRKDDSRGGTRQCAYYKCGKWEEFPRQFAKCRRCRRTKYCSKDCQKNAWVFHRHWCQVANS